MRPPISCVRSSLMTRQNVAETRNAAAILQALGSSLSLGRAGIYTTQRMHVTRLLIASGPLSRPSRSIPRTAWSNGTCTRPKQASGCTNGRLFGIADIEKDDPSASRAVDQERIHRIEQRQALAPAKVQRLLRPTVGMRCRQSRAVNRECTYPTGQCPRDDVPHRSAHATGVTMRPRMPQVIDSGESKGHTKRRPDVRTGRVEVSV